MGSTSLLAKKRKPGGCEIYLSRGTFGGRATWHYLLVDKLKLPLLMTEAQKGTIDLVNYGNIILSGFGENPPEEVREFVQKKYGETVH